MSEKEVNNSSEKAFNVQNMKSQLNRMMDKLSTSQKITMTLVFVAAVAIISTVFFWATKTDYSILYANLTQEDAAQVMNKLQEMSVDYKIQDGNIIYVETKKVNELKLSLASEGLPADPIKGYELFDDNKLGMTDFMQRLNKTRAMEGEISRTIASLEGVKSARVHFVVPKRALFADDKIEPTASIVLNLKGSAGLTKKQIEGIVNLTANSIEGLKRNNISILDNYGNQLNSQEDLTTVSGLTSSQFEVQKGMERNLEMQGQNLLDRVLGPGKAVVKVTADLNFEKVEKVMEEYDPQKQVLRSEERNETTETTPDGGNNTSESNVSNYEINKTVSTVVAPIGSIKRLSIAVSVDGLYESVKDEDGKERMVYKQRSAEEITQLTAMVKSALGFNETRGDVIELANLKFEPDVDSPYYTGEGKMMGLNAQTTELITTSLKYVVLLVAFLILLLVSRSLIRRSREFSQDMWPKLTSNSISGKIITPDGEVIDASDIINKEENMLKDLKKMKKSGNIMEDMSPEARIRAERQEKIKEFVTNNSTDASSLLKSWIYENGELMDV